MEIPRKKSTAKSKGKAKGGTKKAKEEKVDKEVSISTPVEITGMMDIFKTTFDEFSTMPQDFLNNVLNPETISHMIKAFMEGYEGLRGLGPDMDIPGDTKLHFFKAERELLLGIKAAMDLRLKDLDKKIGNIEVCQPVEVDEPKKELKKIKVED